MKRVFKPEQEPEVVLMYEKGYGVMRIAESYNCAPATVWHLLKRNGISLRPFCSQKGELNPKRLFTDEQEKVICQEYVDGATGKELGKKYGTTATKISSMLKRHGIKSRGRSGTGRYASRWNGGVSYDRGYKRLYLPEHPSACKGGLIKEHRLVMEKELGRPP